MSIEIVIASNTKEAFENFNEFGANFDKNLSRAINKIARDYRVEAARRIQSQVNIPSSELLPSAGSLRVSQYASPDKLEAAIFASGKPKGLASYSHGGATGKPGVAVSVKRSSTIYLSHSFLIDFNGGRGSHRVSGQESGVVLAYRLRPGQSISNKIKRTPIGGGLYIFHGPSIRQTFLDESGQGVATDIIPEIALSLEKEVQRMIQVFGR